MVGAGRGDGGRETESVTDGKQVKKVMEMEGGQRQR
jgi:hypothetical protein